MRVMKKTQWLILLLIFIACEPPASAQDVVVVANKGVQVFGIRDADLRAIFIGSKTRLSDGSRAIPVILKGGPAHGVFLRNHVGESPADFQAQSRKLIFTGQGAMPRAFDSEAAVIEFVAATPGAVGYVSRISPQDPVKHFVAFK